MPRKIAHTKDGEAVTTNEPEAAGGPIRELSEQAPDPGTKAALDSLDAYETKLNTFADFQDKLAGAAQVKSERGTNATRAHAKRVANVGRAQVELTRKIARASYTNVGTANQSGHATPGVAGGGATESERAGGVVDIAYERFGDPDAPPVLLIMGLGGGMLGWPAGFCELLVERGLQVIRFDNRDVGESTHLHDAPEPDVSAVVAGDITSASYKLADMAADTAGLLDALELDSAHIVGVSLGGMIAQTLAIEHPERVRSLTSISSSTSDPTVGQPSPKALKALAAPPPQTRQAAMDLAVAVFEVIGSPAFPIDEPSVRERAGASYDRGSDPTGVARQMIAALASPDRTPDLRSVEVPALVLHGAQDPLVNLSGGRATAEALPNAELVVIDGMGHDLPPALWGEITGRIADLADSVERAARV